MEYSPDYDIAFFIARETGKSLGEVLGAELDPVAELNAWGEHFKRYPPMCIGIHHSLAELVAQNHNMAIAKAGKRSGFKRSFELAPWLMSPEIKKLLKEEADESALTRVAALHKTAKENI